MKKMNKKDKILQIRFAKWEKTCRTEEERLGLAYCRFNCWQWDELCGPCPENFYELLPFSRLQGQKTRKDYIDEKIEWVWQQLGAKKCLHYWNVFGVAEPPEDGEGEC